MKLSIYLHHLKVFEKKTSKILRLHGPNSNQNVIQNEEKHSDQYERWSSIIYNQWSDRQNSDLATSNTGLQNGT